MLIVEYILSVVLILVWNCFSPTADIELDFAGESICKISVMNKNISHYLLLGTILL